jgi:hypothetical protein
MKPQTIKLRLSKKRLQELDDIIQQMYLKLLKNKIKGIYKHK